jgi:hypothetical protein
MPTLRAVLADLDPFCLLRDASGNVLTVWQVLERDADLDPERYMRTGISPVRVLRLIDEDTPDPVPVFEEALLECRLGDVVSRLSHERRRWLSENIELICAEAGAMAKEAQRYLDVVPLEPMQQAAVMSLFAKALEDDWREGPPVFPPADEVIAYIRPKIFESLKVAQAQERRITKDLVDNALGDAKYARECLRKLRGLAEPLRAEALKDLAPHQVRSAGSRLAEAVLSMTGHLEGVAEARREE